MIGTKSIPRPGERRLSCAPYVLIVHIVGIERRAEPPVVSYELQDEDRALLESVEHAALDAGWWKTFQPMPRHWS